MCCRWEHSRWKFLLGTNRISLTKTDRESRPFRRPWRKILVFMLNVLVWTILRVTGFFTVNFLKDMTCRNGWYYIQTKVNKIYPLNMLLLFLVNILLSKLWQCLKCYYTFQKYYNSLVTPEKVKTGTWVTKVVLLHIVFMNSNVCAEKNM